MSYQSPHSIGRGSLYQDYFGYAFAAADVAAYWWQPLLKGIGRSQLELAGLQSRNAQALLTWGRSVATSRSPSDIVSANLGLLENLASNVNETLPRVSGALNQAAQAPAAFELLPLPVKRVRDSLVIPGLDADAVGAFEERRVA